MRLPAGAVLSVLARHVGERNGVHIRPLAREIVALHGEITEQLIRGEFPWDRLEREIRKAVLELRLDGHHICAHPAAGYYLAETAEELDRTCLFLYDRAMASLEQVAAMRKISLPDLRGQLRLPT